MVRTPVRRPVSTVIPFALVHAGALGALLVPFQTSYLWLLAALYFIRMFGVTAGYHRYFSHRSYKLHRLWQFLLALLAQTSGQKGVLWWAAHHRFHHQNSDQDSDIHSPIRHGFWWSHVGWILSEKYEDYDPALIKDFSKFPELRFLDRYHWLPPLPLGLACLLLGGWGAFTWGFLLSTALLYHGTFVINSLAHVWGTRRFETPDQSRNNFFLALITMGEGWHNNHHQYMYACRQGLRWWEIDVTYYLVRFLAWLGIAREIREAQHPAAVEIAA